MGKEWFNIVWKWRQSPRVHSRQPICVVGGRKNEQLDETAWRLKEEVQIVAGIRSRKVDDAGDAKEQGDE